MSTGVKIKHEFVEFIPKEREEGVLYVSIPYATAVHNCFCGCGLKVVTPISPVGWQLTFDGETVTFYINRMDTPPSARKFGINRNHMRGKLVGNVMKFTWVREEADDQPGGEPRLQRAQLWPA